MNKIHKLGRTRSNPFGMPLLSILIFLGTCQSMWAQVATNYSFASSVGTYVPITGGSLVATTATINVDDDFYSAATPTVLPAIGFPFSFDGIPYTACTLNANGWIGFGNVSIVGSNDIYAALSSPLVASGMVAAFNRDLVQRNLAPLSEIRVETVGIAPNREYVIQFFNWGFYTGTTNNLDTYNFQIRLQENGNKVVIAYGNMIVTSPAVTATAAFGAGAPQVGLRGASNADFNTRAVSATGTWAASTAGTSAAAVASLSSTQVPPNGLTYTWTPAPCTAVPATSMVISSLPIASSQFIACSGRPFTLSLSASNTGNSFQWQSATYTPGPTPTVGTYVDIVGANGSTYTATQTANTAYRCLISCSTATPVPTPTIASRVLVGMSPTVECYCAATVVPNVACITNVTLGGANGINNTTTCAPNVNHVAANTGVTNFPSNITTSLTQGSSPSITVTTTVATASIGVWIDFNGNGVYDATIVPAVGAEYFPVVGGTATIVVPLTAAVGLTKMRVRSRIGALASGSACLSFTTAASSGEIEDYYISINPAGCTGVVVLPSASLLNLTKDVAIANIALSASGGAPGAPTYTYALTGGTLPVGVTFVGGIISGTPTTLENGFFIITATSTPGACQGSMVYNFNVNNACTAVVLSATPAPVITPPSAIGAYSFIISTPVTITLASTGGLATASGYTYAITAGALPVGLLLNTTTGIISGTPNTVTSAPGTFSVTSTSVAGNCSKTVVYTFTTVCPTVVLSPAAGALTFQWNNAAPAILASGGANYTFTVTSTGTDIPPTGLTLTSTGEFTGTPTVLGQTGTFTVTVNTTTVALPTACTAVTVVYTYKVVCSDIKVTPVVPYIVFTKGFAIEDIILSASEVGSTPLYGFAVTGLPTGMTFVTIPATTTPLAPAIYKITGTPTVSGKGTFVVTATNPNAVALACAGTSSFEYTVIDNPTTSLDALANSVKISPNPSKGEFNIDFSGVALGKAVIRVYDAQGKQVYTSNVSNNQMTISLENLSSGIYLMEVDSAKGRILKRLAKQ